MNKSAVKGFAVWARQQLTGAVRDQFLKYGITEAGTVEQPGLSRQENRQRLQLAQAIDRKGYAQVVEETARGWLIRLAAQRLLEVNGLPDSGALMPCFPLPAPQLDKVAEKLRCDISPQDFQQVEIIGWLYQFYCSEKHHQVVDPLYGTVIAKEDIPAATQLFTTEWVIRYLLDNSLGRYWLERNPDSPLASGLTYLVTPKDGTIQRVSESIAPEELKILDPCVGAGHFLSYAFELLMEFYRERGWSDQAAARSILEHNLYGLDIDEPVVQLACFAITVKAAQYDPALWNAGIKPHILAVQDSEPVTGEWICRFAAGSKSLARMAENLKTAFENAGEYGSMIVLPDENLAPLYERLRQLDGEDQQTRRFYALVQQAELLTQTYHTVATNPPYMNKYSPQLKDFLNRNFPDYKGDLFSVFMFRSLSLCREKGYCGFMTPMVWMFLKTYEPLRKYLLAEKSIATLIQFEYSAFEDATVPVCAFVLKNQAQQTKALCFRLSSFPGDMEVQRRKVLEALENKACGYFYEADQSRFSMIPNSPVAYWLTERFLAAFENKTLDRIAKPRQGLATGCNQRFIRLWFEVADSRVCYNARSLEEARKTGRKWFPYNKGGEFRKWYGNNDYLVNWEHDGSLIRNFRNEKGQLRSRPQNTDYYFRESISWSLISSGKVAFRYKPYGHIFDVAGMSCFAEENLLYLLGLCNSSVVREVLAVLAPTINFQAGDIAKIPVAVDAARLAAVERTVAENIDLSQQDWDGFEVSWDFKGHPLACLGADTMATTISEKFRKWQEACETRFSQLKANEEELNRIFIDIYGLQEELTPEVNDQDVTVRRADLQREIKSLISYAVGCLFGRYSLDEEGLCYAGGVWKEAGYRTVIPVRDNILPLWDEEEADDDLTDRIVRWVETVYGRETLEENLLFIANALGGKGTPRQVLRHYLLTGFYADHVKIYRGRPVYWLFSSGKKNGFKALIYMHRYQPELINRMHCDYVLPRQVRCRTRLLRLEETAASGEATDKLQRKKQILALQGQLAELTCFEEKLRRLGEQRICLDPDDGVRANYAKLQDVLEPIK